MPLAIAAAFARIRWGTSMGFSLATALTLTSTLPLGKSFVIQAAESECNPGGVDYESCKEHGDLPVRAPESGQAACQTDKVS